MAYKDIIAILCPDVDPIETGYLWAKFTVGAIKDCDYVYYCANDEIAGQLLVNQIKPYLTLGKGYFVIFPISDTVDINSSNTPILATLSITHFGNVEHFKSESIARTRVTELLGLYRQTQNKVISSIRINNSTFREWSEDNSYLQQYTAVATVKAILPYSLAPDCL